MDVPLCSGAAPERDIFRTAYAVGYFLSPSGLGGGTYASGVGRLKLTPGVSIFPENIPGLKAPLDL